MLWYCLFVALLCQLPSDQQLIRLLRFSIVPQSFMDWNFNEWRFFFHFHLYFTFIRLASQSKFEQMVFFPYEMLLEVCTISVHGPGYLFYVKRILTHMNWLIVISGCVYVCCLSLANKTFTVLICLKVDAKWRCL